jgi:hypothetical protein
MKTWKGQAFEGEWHREMLKWIDGRLVGYGPTWQFKHEEDANWSSICRHAPHSRDKVIEYRWAPKPKRTVTINGKTLVAPEVVAPADGTRVYLIDNLGGTGSAPWTNSSLDIEWLKANIVFLTREDAQAMADWLVKCRRGET